MIRWLPRRRNVTTSMVALKKNPGHIRKKKKKKKKKIVPKMVNPGHLAGNEEL